MKACCIFLFAVAFLALANAEESPERRIPDRLKKIRDECAEANAISPPALCKNNKLGIQKSNGDIDKDTLKTSIGKIPRITADKVDKIVAECGERKGDTAGEAAIALDECLKKNLRPEGRPEGHPEGRSYRRPHTR